MLGIENKEEQEEEEVNESTKWPNDEAQEMNEPSTGDWRVKERLRTFYYSYSYYLAEGELKSRY